VRLGRDLLHQARNRVGPERQHAGQQLKQRDAEGKKVRLRRHRTRIELLRRHVRRRSKDDAGARRAAVLEARHAEIHDSHAAVFLVEDDVRGLDVAVNDAALVREVDRVGDARAHLADEPRWEHAPLGRVGREVDALHVLHRHVDLAFMFAGLADLDDVGVGKRARGLGLAQEAQLRLVEEVIRPVIGEGQELQRDHGFRALVHRAKHRRGRAAAELLLEAKMVEKLAGPELRPREARFGRWRAAACGFSLTATESGFPKRGFSSPTSCRIRR
jgi:hypothetical protein